MIDPILIVCILLIIVPTLFLIYAVTQCKCECKKCVDRCECSDCPTCDCVCPDCNDCPPCVPTSIRNNSGSIHMPIVSTHLNPSIDERRIGFTNNEWALFTGQGVDIQTNPVLTCVGMGDKDASCNTSQFVCAGGNTFGTDVEQWGKLEEALYNGGVHPDCPV